MLPYAPIKIGISSCLLGEDVRYDGRNKYDGYIVEAFGQYVEFMPVCPETGIGLGVPRPPLKLVVMKERVAAVGADNPAIDVSDAITDFGKKQARALNTICGYIFKSRSPSCGLADTPITTDDEEETRGPGLFTRQIIEAMPLLPVTDEVSLKLDKHANNFLERVFAYNRWQQFLEWPLSDFRLRTFHTLHTSELERHRAGLARELSDILFSVNDSALEKTASIYLENFMAALQVPAAREIQTEELIETHTRLSKAFANHTD